MQTLQPPPPSLVASGGTGVGLSVNLPQASLCRLAEYTMFNEIAERGLGFSNGGFYETWEPGTLVAETLTKGGASIASHHGDGRGGIWSFEGGNWFGVLTAWGDSGYWEMEVAAQSQDVVDKVLEAVKTLAGEPAPLDDDSISLGVWTESPMGGGYCRHIRMKVGVWGEVEENYPLSIRGDLTRLASALPAKSEGGVIMLCGPAGTGKTRAIEALCHAWGGAGARLGVVVDSDRMLGSAAYLTDVITAAWGDQRQVIIAEDVDEMVAVGPKSKETSKLLNIADGIVGRAAGGGTLLVLTANLPRNEIADYVIRPGRAASVIEFEHFGAEEARGWIEARGGDASAVEDDDVLTLAELYGALRAK